MNILEEFWYGNIEPAEYDISSGKEYKELLQLISRNDKIGQITKTFRGKLWILGLFLTLAKKMRQGAPKKKKDPAKKKSSGFSMPKVDSGMLQMMNGFTVLRLTGMLGMVNVSFTKEELLKINSKLNKIRKPKD